jgi:hypothetical protein
MQKFWEWFLMGLFGGMGLCCAVVACKAIAWIFGHAGFPVM